jgi:hypothetical protein
VIYILDLDGTICDHSHRTKLIENGINEENWKEFLDSKMVGKDVPIHLVKNFLDNLNLSITWFVTGRGEKLRNVTKWWLNKYYNIAVDDSHLLMRGSDEITTASSYKERVLLEKILPEIEKLDDMSITFIDDDPFVLNMYSKYGLALKAPECWKVLYHPKPSEKEELFSK